MSGVLHTKPQHNQFISQVLYDEYFFEFWMNIFISIAVQLIVLKIRNKDINDDYLVIKIVVTLN